MPLDFTAIDFETANGSPASACAVGITRIRGGTETLTRGWLIRPPAGHDNFRPVNIGLHGIRPADVAGAPSWPQLLPELLDLIGDDVLIAHNARFDMGVLAATSIATAATPPPVRSFCSLRVARATYRLPRHRLPEAARAAGFTELRHHDPVSDARAAAAIIVDAATRHAASDLGELAAKLKLPIERWVTDPHSPGCAELIRAATFA